MTEAKRPGARAMLVGAAAASAIGVAIAGTLSRDVGGVVVVLAWAAMIYALHAYGRAE